MAKCFFIGLLLLFSFSKNGDAQLFDRLKDGEPIRKYVTQLGVMQDRPLQDLIDSFRSQKYDQLKMAYAIYYWIAQNITFDTRAFHHPNNSLSNASAALKTRKATSEGYAAVFQTLCNVAGIKCYTVHGFVKAVPEDIGELNTATKHAWNVVFIKHTLLLIDAALGAGDIDFKRKRFTKKYNDGWVFTNKNLFFLNHFSSEKSEYIPPQNAADKLMFKNSPVVFNNAILMNVRPSASLKGVLKGREGKSKTIDLEIGNNDLTITTATIISDGIETPVEVKGYENILVLDIPFVKKGNHTLVLRLNNNNVFGFKTQVSKAASSSQRRKKIHHKEP